MGNEQISEIRRMLAQALEDTGLSLRTSSAELIDFAAELAARLSAHIGDPDYDAMVRVCRDILVLAAGIRTVTETDRVMQRVMEILVAALRLLAASVVGT